AHGFVGVVHHQDRLNASRSRGAKTLFRVREADHAVGRQRGLGHSSRQFVFGKRRHGNHLHAKRIEFRQGGSGVFVWLAVFVDDDTDWIEEDSVDGFHALSAERADASSPFAISIFIALYLSGAAFASARDASSSASPLPSVLPASRPSTVVSRSGRPA